MRILVVSDTHSNINNVIKVLELVKDIDRIIHLGDLEMDAEELEYTQSYPIDYIAGNCDFITSTPREKILKFGHYNILITHGHTYNVKSEYETLAHIGLEKGVKAVLFGHTHIPYLEKREDIILMNPGSISQPRGGFSASYGIINFEKGDDPKYEIHFLKKIK